MVRYTPEQKEQAMTMIQEIGVYKTSAETGIAVPTLYSWRSAANPKPADAAPAEGTKVKKTAPAKSKKAVSADTKTTTRAKAKETAEALLAEDDDLLSRYNQLEAEVVELRVKNAKLKKALAALMD